MASELERWRLALPRALVSAPAGQGLGALKLANDQRFALPWIAPHDPFDKTAKLQFVVGSKDLPRSLPEMMGRLIHLGLPRYGVA